MSEIALVTANFGGIDAVKALPSRTDIDAFYFTDTATLETIEPSIARSWTAIIAPDTEMQLSARLRSRYFKQQIHRLPETRPYRWLVWADSSIAFKELQFVHEIVRALQQYPPEQRLMLIPHPDRKTIREEIEFVQRQIAQGNEYLRARYGADKTADGVASLLSKGFSLEAKLWCGGFWVIENNSIIQKAWDAWWSHLRRFGVQDQYCLPAAMAEFGLKPQDAGFHLRSNQHFDLVKHLV